MKPEPVRLPIAGVLPELRQALSGNGAVVLQAPPGAGKTTGVPPALLDEPWLAGKSILLLEPRRLAATNAARYMARVFDEPVGRTVGYTIRYARRRSAETRIEVVTEGILTRRLQADPILGGIGMVIFDEFHERSLHADLALALCRDAQTGLREDLKILVMSATLDGGPVARLLGEAPIVTSAGRTHPVSLHYLAGDPAGPVAETAAAGVRRALRETEGDILLFLPGAGEVRRCLGRLGDLAGGIDLHPLYGDLPFAAQERAILPGKRRKVVLATNIAETSLTIEGVRVVVDSGLERRPRYDPGRGMTSLETMRISRASAEQRAGRAGRQSRGACYRLWSEGTHGALLPFTPPEIRTADLAPLALELACWGVSDPQQLAWLDPPPPGHLAGARELLRLLGALDGNNLPTGLGRAMAEYPLHPRLARLLAAAREAGCPGPGADLAALLSERDAGAGTPRRASGSDLLDRLELLHSGGSPAVHRAARHLRRLAGADKTEEPADIRTVGRLLASAYPDRIARRREADSRRYLLSGGQGARLSPRSAVPPAEWLVAVELFGRPGGEGEIRLANVLEREDVEELFGEGADWTREVEWDERAGRVVGREVRRLGSLVLRERPVEVRPDDAAPALLQVVRRRGLDLLNWHREARQWRARMRLLAETFPEGGWPDVSDAALLGALEEWLQPYLPGLTTLPALRRLDPLPALQALLDWQRRSEMDRLAPERLQVPSGARIRLDYEPQDGPVLAVKLQELFGLEQTPTVAAGRVPVLIHLLSPAGRPLAVTRDLTSFWDSVYPEVRKEMKGRYPKHPWPEDPRKAEATGRTKRRSQGR